MIRIHLIKEGKAIKRISSRVSEAVVLEQLKRFNGEFDEIVYEGEVSEAAKDIFKHVAKKVIPAAMAAGVALGAHSGDASARERYMYGPGHSIPPQVQTQYDRNSGKVNTYDYDNMRTIGSAQVTPPGGYGGMHLGRQMELRAQQFQQQNRYVNPVQSSAPVFVDARYSLDGRSMILYDTNHNTARIPLQGLEWYRPTSSRMGHYMTPGGRVFYVHHPANPNVRADESIIDEDPTVGTISANPSKQIAGVRPTAPAMGAAQAAAGEEDEDTAAGVAAASSSSLIKPGQTGGVNQPQGQTGGVNQPQGQGGKELQLDKNHSLDPQTLAAIKKAGINVTIKESFLNLLEGHTDPELQSIIDNYEDSWHDFANGGNITDNKEFYAALVNYFTKEGNLTDNADKADQITNWLDTLLANSLEVNEMNEVKDDFDDEDELAASPNDVADADRNIIMQIRKAADYEKPTDLKLGDGSKVRINNKIAKTILLAFDSTRPQNKEQIQQVLNTKAGFVDIVNHLTGKRMESTKTSAPVIDEAASADEHMAYELINIGEQDSELYRQQFIPIIKNLMRKKAKGVYNNAAAAKLWRYWIDNIVKKHASELGVSNSTAINGLTRNYAAEIMADRQSDEMDMGNWDDIGKMKEGIEEDNISEASEQYSSLTDVYPDGTTEVWYWKDDHGRDFMMGFNWLKKRGIDVSAKTIPQTHALIGTLKETNPEKIFYMMQGETWSPEGQARNMIRASGTGHTSMSVGDVIHSNGKWLMVDRFGFQDIEKPAQDEAVQMTSTHMEARKQAALITNRVFEGLDEMDEESLAEGFKSLNQTVLAKHRIKEDMTPGQKAAIPGMHQLSADQYYGLYKFSKDIAGHNGKSQGAPNGKSDGKIADKGYVVAYSPEEEKMIKAVDKKAKNITGSGSKEVKESLKIVKKLYTGKKTAHIYKDTETNEYQVKFLGDGGKPQGKPDYQTDDLKDANDCASAWVMENLDIRNSHYWCRIDKTRKLIPEGYKKVAKGYIARSY